MEIFALPNKLLTAIELIIFWPETQIREFIKIQLLHDTACKYCVLNDFQQGRLRKSVRGPSILTGARDSPEGLGEARLIHGVDFWKREQSRQDMEEKRKAMLTSSIQIHKWREFREHDLS